MVETVMFNLLSPAVLFFALGLGAAFLKSDLKIPSALSDSLSIYLLIAIGLKGGIELSGYRIDDFLLPLMGTLLLGTIIPVVMFIVSRWMGIDRHNAIGLAATYGSVSIVTFGAAIAFLQHEKIQYESYMTAMVVLLESPAIFVSLFLLGWLNNREQRRYVHCEKSEMGIDSNRPHPRIQLFDPQIFKESLLNKSVLLLVGAMVIGTITGERAIPVVKTLFIDLYAGILVIFLLGMGMSAGERIVEIKQYGFKMLILAIMMPLLFGIFAVLIGYTCGLSIGGTAIMGIMGASASYIAAPAALRHSVPQANPSIYLGMSLGITFPFNLIVGLPLYVLLAQWIHG
jgi:hypothetical protein